jgi:hypothetical protein
MNTRITTQNRFVKWRLAALPAVAFAILPSTPALAGDDNDAFKFELVSSAHFAACTRASKDRIRGSSRDHECYRLGFTAEHRFRLFCDPSAPRPVWSILVSG